MGNELRNLIVDTALFNIGLKVMVDISAALIELLIFYEHSHPMNKFHIDQNERKD